MNSSTITMDAIDELNSAANNKNTDEQDEVQINSTRKEQRPISTPPNRLPNR